MIGIIDYGLGNVRAFANVYKRLNIPYKLVRTAEDLQSATRIILPGVGAFDYAMTLLNKSGLREKLDYLVLDKGIPVLGICVGMQILADSSEEGHLKGLGWVPGSVKKFPTPPVELRMHYPLPHMGWNEITINQSDSLLSGLASGARFYFLHSYYFECQDKGLAIATSEYNIRFSCIVKHHNIYGIQCHPEKSHENGIVLLKNFALV
jgi:glutamine amidotransferase